MPGPVLNAEDTALYETKSLSPKLCILMEKDRTPNKQGNSWDYNCYRENNQEDVREVEGGLL